MDEMKDRCSTIHNNCLRLGMERRKGRAAEKVEALKVMEKAERYIKGKCDKCSDPFCGNCETKPVVDAIKAYREGK